MGKAKPLEHGKQECAVLFLRALLTLPENYGTVIGCLPEPRITWGITSKHVLTGTLRKIEVFDGDKPRQDEMPTVVTNLGEVSTHIIYIVCIYLYRSVLELL